VPVDSLWYRRGSVALPENMDDEAALDRIEKMLTRQWKHNTERGTDFVAFTGGFSVGMSWLALVIYDRGVFWIVRESEGRRLRYRLRSLYGFVFCLFAALVVFIFGLLGEGLHRGLILGCLAFGWLYGMNMLIAAMRVPDLIERTVTAA